MPIYEYYCRNCKKTFEEFHKITRIPKRARCQCGLLAKRVLSPGAIMCDSETDVKWLASACQVLQPDGEKPIETRGEYRRYLKEHNLECKG